MLEANAAIVPSRRASKFPDAGTTVFTVMSQLAQKTGAINLGQGFPDFEPDPRLLAAVSKALTSGFNQYAPMTGLPALREAIRRKITDFGGRSYDPETEITVTAGATEALTSAILALVHPGDSVLIFEPAYDSYAPAIELAGGQVVRVALDADFRPDWAVISAAWTPAIRGVIFNSPHNPGASVWSDADLQQLTALCKQHDVWVIADEVYEHMVFDGQMHRSVAHYPDLASRSVLVSSFGKSLHVTGWKIAYMAAPAELSRELRLVHQYNTFSVATPLQAGIADYLNENGNVLKELPDFYQKKRDFFRNGLGGLGLQLLPCAGTYFQVVDYSAISDLNDRDFAHWLTQTIGVACIPLSAFYASAPQARRVRFCFAKQEQTLETALERLQALR